MNSDNSVAGLQSVLGSVIAGSPASGRGVTNFFGRQFLALGQDSTIGVQLDRHLAVPLPFLESVFRNEGRASELFQIYQLLSLPFDPATMKREYGLSRKPHEILLGETGHPRGGFPSPRMHADKIDCKRLRSLQLSPEPRCSTSEFFSNPQSNKK